MLRVLRWAAISICLVGAVACVVGFVYSTWVTFLFSLGRHHFVLGSGGVTYLKAGLSSVVIPGAWFRYAATAASPVELGLSIRTRPFVMAFVPLWAPFLALMAYPLGVLFWSRGPIRRWRRRRAGLCGKCAYDLTGNTSGKCPECGTKV